MFTAHSLRSFKTQSTQSPAARDSFAVERTINENHPKLREAGGAGLPGDAIYFAWPLVRGDGKAHLVLASTISTVNDIKEVDHELRTN